MKHNIYEFSLFMKILCSVSKGSLNTPEYKSLVSVLVPYYLSCITNSNAFSNTVSIIKSKHLDCKFIIGCYLAIRALANAC